MEDKFLIAEEISESDRVKGRILKSSIDLSIVGGYFEESGRYKVTMGSRGVEHTRELFQAYENTWKYWKNNQEQMLDCILEFAADQYKTIWEVKESLFKTPIYAEYNEAKKHYEQLMDKKQLKNVARITRFHIIPLINNEVCYFAVCLADKTDYEVFRVPSIWIILEQNKLAGARDMLWNKKNMDELLFDSARSYMDDQEPDIFLPMEPFEKVKIPHNLGIGGDLKKFERLVPYLENMKLDAAPKRDWEYFFLPRGTYPIGEYNGMIYFLLKIKNKKWEECPVFDIDGALEMEGCMPLAENLSAFIKLGIMAHSFMALSFIARRPEKEYRIDGQQYRDWDVSEEIAVLEENFHLPEIDNVITYIDTLKKKKSYARKGKAVLHKMFKKRGMKEEYYDTYGGWRWF